MPSLTKVQTGFLEAVNPFTLASGTASAPIISFSNSAATGIFSPSAGALAFSTGSTQNALTILSGGNIGIGVTNPSTKLHVFGGITRLSNGLKSASNTHLQLASSDASNQMYLTFFNNGGNYWAIQSTEQDIDYRPIVLNPSGATVGIGQTNPTDMVHITTATNAFVRMERTSSGSEGAVIIGASSAGNEIYSRSTGTTAKDFRIVLGTSEALRIATGGNIGIGVTNPSYKLQVNGVPAFNGVPYSDAINYEETSYFSMQRYIENDNFNGMQIIGGVNPGYTTDNNTSTSYSKVTFFNGYYEGISDFIPVTSGETIYGELWAKRNTGATGTAGVLYLGIARFDKDKKPIAGNSGLTYPFTNGGQTVPTNSTWTKYSAQYTLETAHTPYNGSDGGPVRYIRVYLIVNYPTGTIPTYITGISVRKTGISIGERIGIGTNNPTTQLQVIGTTRTTSLSVNDGTYEATISSFASNNGELPNPSILMGTNGNYPLSLAGDLSGGLTSSGVVISYYASGGWKRALEIFNTNSSLSNLILMKSGGPVGIGTASPAEKLHIHAPGADLATIRLSGGATLQRPYTLRQGIVGVSNAGFSIRDETAPATTRFAIDSVGNVGIGTDNPSSNLHVYGNIFTNSAIRSSNLNNRLWNAYGAFNLTDGQSQVLFYNGSGYTRSNYKIYIQSGHGSNGFAYIHVNVSQYGASYHTTNWNVAYTTYEFYQNPSDPSQNGIRIVRNQAYGTVYFYVLVECYSPIDAGYVFPGAALSQFNYGV